MQNSNGFLWNFDTAASISSCNLSVQNIRVTLVEKFEKHSSLIALRCIPNFAFLANRLFAIGSQLSPEQGSSGIEMLETDTFKLHCFQTLTGTHFQTGQRHAMGLARGRHWPKLALVTKGVVVNLFWDKCTVICFVNLKPIFNLAASFVHVQPSSSCVQINSP